MTPRCRPAELARVLAALPVLVESVDVDVGMAEVAAYPGGARPTSVVRVSGRGHTGRGENVAWSGEAHAAFASRARTWLVRSGGAAIDPGGADVRRGGAALVVGTAVRADAPPYERAALEAALIDLALRQAGVTLCDLTGVTAARLRTVVSFAACADPAARVRELRSGGCGADLKIDVDPAWDQAAQAGLERQAGVVILDFKGRGHAALAQELSRRFPSALFEDPPAGAAHSRVARDALVLDAAAVAATLARGEGVNLKAPRMGGPLELLRGLDLVWRAPEAGEAPAHTAGDPPFTVAAAVYLGGMFEVGVGRVQARQLAALYCPDAPNDLAPHPPKEARTGTAPAARQGSQMSTGTGAVVRLDGPGFGADDLTGGALARDRGLGGS